MSDDEYDRMSNTSQTSMKGDEAFAKRKAGLHKNELNEQLKEYITQWRDERSKEVNINTSRHCWTLGPTDSLFYYLRRRN